MKYTAKPVPAPDRATLLKFLLGTLLEEELRTVQDWLATDPTAAEQLAELQARDHVTAVLDARALADGARLADTVPQTSPPTVPDVPPECVGGYEIVRELGHGGMGVVYEVQDPNLPRRLAVKVLPADAGGSAEARARFRKEAEAVSRIDHPNVVPVFAFGEDAGRLFLVMPLLKGETLAERLQRGPLTPGELLRVARDIASALEAAHKAGLIHRDIKPANVWLDAADGRARVLDFGLVKSQEAPAHTETGAIMGSAHYMSPQQANGQPLDARTDLFSLGALLYHAATGRRPFDGETVYAVLRAVVNATPPAPSGVSPQMAQLIRKLLEKEPTARPASATDVLLELANPVPQPVPPKRRFPRWALAAGLLLALVAGAIVYEVKFSNGTLTVEVTAEADVRLKNGALEVYDEAGKLKYTIAPNARVADVARGTYKLKVVGADGVELDTEEFTMKRNGTAVVRVRAKPNEKPVVKDAERRAAESVFSVGGTVALWEGNERRWIETANALPREPFALNAVSFGKGVKHVTDDDLAVFKGCPRLQQLDLRDTRVTDAGLAHFAGCRELQLLYVNGKGITDKGLAHFADLPNLTQLSLAGTSVTDTGLARFAKCKHLQELGLTDTAVTDAGLAHFQKSFELHGLSIERTGVTDAGLAHLSDCRDIRWLALAGTKITSAGLKPFAGCNLAVLDLTDTAFDDTGFAHLKNSTQLRHLPLSGTRVTDAGLGALPPLPALTGIDLRKTKVTAPGVAALAKARPQCEITWDGGTIAPATATDPDRRAALWVLSTGEQVLIWEGTGHRFIEAANALPREPFPLWAPHIKKNPQAVTDDKLAVFKDCTRVKQLDLPGVRVTDAGLAHFAKCKELDYVGLDGRGVTDTGLAHLAGLSNLTHLSLSETRVTDAGLAHFAKCKHLQYLTLSDTKVADAGLAHFRDCAELRYLRLEGTLVTDAGLAHLSGCRELETLRLCETRTTSAALKPLANCNFVNLDLTGTDFDDTGFAHLKNSTNLRGAVLQKTKVTKEGVAAFAAARPNCRILWDGGTIEPGGAPSPAGTLGRAEFPTYTRLAQIGTHDRRHRANITHMDVAVRWGRAATVAADGLKVWETATLKLVAEVPRLDETAPVWHSCAIIAENHVAVSTRGGGKNHGLTVFDISQQPPRVVRRVEAKEGHMCDVAVSGGREWVAFAHDDAVQLWKVAALLNEAGVAAHTIKGEPSDREHSQRWNAMAFANEQQFAFKTQTGIRRFALDKNGWDERAAVPTSGLCVSFVIDNRGRLLVCSMTKAGDPAKFEEWNLSGAKPQLEAAVVAPLGGPYRVQLYKGIYVLAEGGSNSVTYQLPLKADTKPTAFPYPALSPQGGELRHVGLDTFIARDGPRVRHFKLKDGLMSDSHRGDANDSAFVLHGSPVERPTVAGNRVGLAGNGGRHPARVWDFSGPVPALAFEDPAPVNRDRIVLSPTGTKALVARFNQPPELHALGKPDAPPIAFSVKAQGYFPLGLTRDTRFALTSAEEELHVWDCENPEKPIFTQKLPPGRRSSEPYTVPTANGWVTFLFHDGPNKELGFVPVHIDVANGKPTARVGAHMRNGPDWLSVQGDTALTAWSVPNEPESWRFQLHDLTGKAAPREVKYPLALQKRFHYSSAALEPGNARAAVWTNAGGVGGVWVVDLDTRKVLWEYKFGGEFASVQYAGPNRLLVLHRNGVVEVIEPKLAAPK